MSPLPIIEIDLKSPVPPYEQLRSQLEMIIRSGHVAPGAQLPPLRQLAADLGLAVGTAARAYKELETAGLIRSRRGGGTQVTEAAGKSSASERRSVLTATADEFVHRSRRLGFSPHEIRSAVAEALDGE